MPADPDNVQVPVKVPAPLLARVAVPPGVMSVPGEVSLTVTVHVVGEFTVTGEGAHTTVVVVVRTVTVTAVLAELDEWFVSPLKLAVSV